MEHCLIGFGIFTIGVIIGWRFAVTGMKLLIKKGAIKLDKEKLEREAE